MEEKVPECVKGGYGLLLFFLSGWRRTGATAGAAVFAATNQIAARAKVLATTAATRAEHAGWSERGGLVEGARCLETTQVVAADLARGKVCWWCLVAVVAGEVACVAAAHGHTATASAGLLAETLHFSFLLGAGGLFVLVYRPQGEID